MLKLSRLGGANAHFAPPLDPPLGIWAVAGNYQQSGHRAKRERAVPGSCPEKDGSECQIKPQPLSLLDSRQQTPLGYMLNDNMMLMLTVN